MVMVMLGVVCRLLDVMMMLVMMAGFVMMVVMRSRGGGGLGGGDATREQAGAHHERSEDFLHCGIPGSVDRGRNCAACI